MNQNHPKSLIVSYEIDGSKTEVIVNRNMTRDEINEIFWGINPTKISDLKIWDALISITWENTTVADVVLALTTTRTQKEVEEYDTSQLDEAKRILNDMATTLTNNIELTWNIDDQKRKKRKIEIQNIHYKESDNSIITWEFTSYGQTITFEIATWNFRVDKKLEINDPYAFNTKINNKNLSISILDLHLINTCMHYLTVMWSKDKENPFCYDYDANGNYVCIKDAQKTFDWADFSNLDKTKKILKYLKGKSLLRLFRTNKRWTDLSWFIKMLNEKALEDWILSQQNNTNSN